MLLIGLVKPDTTAERLISPASASNQVRAEQSPRSSRLGGNWRTKKVSSAHHTARQNSTSGLAKEQIPNGRGDVLIPRTIVLK